MVMEKLYGRDQIRRFLQFELDRYLRSRGGEAGHGILRPGRRSP